MSRSVLPSRKSLRLRCKIILAFVAKWIISARWAPHGFAAIPTTAIDPPHSAASPAVPALQWVRVPIRSPVEIDRNHSDQEANASVSVIFSNSGRNSG